MSQLGNFGRHGNRLFQNMFLYTYAAMHNLRVEAPAFEHSERFGFKFDPISQRLPAAHERFAIPGDIYSEQLPPEGDEFVDKDWHGYGQFHTRWYAPHKGELQKKLSPWPFKDRTFDARLLDYGSESDWIALHYRAGDYLNNGIFWRPPIEWYLSVLDKLWQKAVRPHLLVATEDPSILRYFNHYSPHVSLFVPPVSSVIEDWSMLTACEYMIIPNSTFSFTAAMANQFLKECWRASLAVGGFERINPWNALPLNLERAENFKHLLEPLQA
jgi:hypothetical protein